jgi:hypothetical protein
LSLCAEVADHSSAPRFSHTPRELN